MTLERRAGRLPAEMTSFIGRRAELTEIRRLLGQCRLLTLIGPGGVGKTRLAVRAADEAARGFADGVCFVDLGSLRQPGLLAETLCEALGLPGQSSEQAVDMLAGHLGDRNLLIVLDTCEHLVDACAILAEVLLSVAPRLRVLATSRQPLELAGEHIVAVEPLDRPDLDHIDPLRACASVDLFTARAVAVAAGWSLTPGNRDAVATLCHRLDGIPLAIELAAAQVRTLTVEQIVARLDGKLLGIRGRRTAHRRHQTLYAALDWSHELCSPDERLLWARLSVFRGDFDLEAAEHVCADARLPADDILGLLSGLIDKSVLLRAERGGDARYQMLDTIREYGAEQLEALGQTERLRTAALDWFSDCVLRARPELMTVAQPQWLDWIVREQANLRVVIEHGIDTLDDAPLIQVALGIGRLLVLIGRIGEARHWATRVLAGRDTSGPAWSETLALFALLAALQNDLEEAEALERRASAQAAGADDPVAEAYLAMARGLIATYRDEDAEALREFDAARELHRLNGEHDVLVPIVDVLMAMVCAFSGDCEVAEKHAARAVQVGEDNGELWVRSYGLIVWGLASWLSGDPTRALPRAQEGLRMKRDLDDWLGISVAMELVSACHAVLGDPARTARLLGTADQARSFTGTTLLGPRHTIIRQTHELNAREMLGNDAFQRAYDAGLALGAQAAIADALDEVPETSRDTGDDACADEPNPLTRREMEIAKLVSEGMSNRGIAERLVISKRTADAHIEHIFAKLGFSSRTQVATWYTERHRTAP